MNLENDLPTWCHTTPADGVPITDSYRSSRIEGHSGIFQIITTPYYCAKRHSAPPNVFLSGVPRIPRQPTGLCVPCWKAWESRTTVSLSNQIILSDQGPALAVLGGRARAKRGRCQHPSLASSFTTGEEKGKPVKGTVPIPVPLISGSRGFGRNYLPR